MAELPHLDVRPAPDFWRHRLARWLEEYEIETILEAGCEAELQKPQGLSELVDPPGDSGPPILRIGQLSFHPESYEVQWDGGGKRLTPKEGDVLKLLLQRVGRTTERDLICRLVWGESGYFVGRSLDVYITRLRKILKADPEVKLETIHGVGFRLEGPASSGDPDHSQNSPK